MSKDTVSVRPDLTGQYLERLVHAVARETAFGVSERHEICERHQITTDLYDEIVALPAFQQALTEHALAFATKAPKERLQMLAMSAIEFGLPSMVTAMVGTTDPLSARAEVMKNLMKLAGLGEGGGAAGGGISIQIHLDKRRDVPRPAEGETIDHQAEEITPVERTARAPIFSLRTAVTAPVTDPEDEPIDESLIDIDEVMDGLPDLPDLDPNALERINRIRQAIAQDRTADAIPINQPDFVEPAARGFARTEVSIHNKGEDDPFMMDVSVGPTRVGTVRDYRPRGGNDE
jgi:hypothetical protein